MAKGKGPGDYSVGYGRPPKEHQFPPRKSGNSAGRPRKKTPAGFFELIREELNQKITITENGNLRKVTIEEALVRKFLNSALTGSPASCLKSIQYLCQVGCLNSGTTQGPLDREAVQELVEALAREAAKHEELNRVLGDRRYGRSNSD